MFVVHGIGESMWSKKEVTISPSLIQIVNDSRIMIQRRQLDDWKKSIANKKNGSGNPPPKRIEILPIVWYGEYFLCLSLITGVDALRCGKYCFLALSYALLCTVEF